jgi:hypothetical protein
MWLIDVAEWCVEALVLGLAFFFFAAGTFIIMTVLSITYGAFKRSDLKAWIDNQ